MESFDGTFRSIRTSRETGLSTINCQWSTRHPALAGLLTNIMNYLQPYKGKDTRHTCPSCKAKLSFTQYLDGSTHKPIHHTVGRCNRESKCGYHYTPKQFFIDNPSLSPLRQPTEGRVRSSSPNYRNADMRSTPSPSGRVGVGSIPFYYLENSISYESNFVTFLKNHFSEEQINTVLEKYLLGATKNKEVIFWQIDINGKVRTGKIMQYNPTTGKRIKHESGAIDWVHNKLKKIGTSPEDYNLQQCFFGEHLLKIYPEKSVAIVESEKSTIIASIIFPDLIWLPTGSINGLSFEKSQVLKGRDVTLYPDLGVYEKWSLKATEIQKQCNCNIILSNLLEIEATDTDRANGLDIADYIIAELISLSSRRGAGGEVIPEIQKTFSSNLQAMIEKNKTLLVLINGLQLEEI